MAALSGPLYAFTYHALGFTAAMSDLPQHTEKGGTLYVFALP